MTFDDFSRINRERCESPQGFNHPLSGWSTSDWMTALMGEVGEAANVVKKLNRVRDGVPGNKLSATELRRQLRRELGDVFVYLDLMAQSLGFSIADAATEVFNSKSIEIGYPTVMEKDRGEKMSVEFWTCPNCAFSFDAVHKNEDGGYSCPNCEEARLRAEVERLKKAHEQILRIPYKPFPDPVAHSWKAYGLAVLAAYQNIRHIARAALAPDGKA